MIVFSFSRKECEANAVALKKMDVTDDDEKRLIDEVPKTLPRRLNMYFYLDFGEILYGKSKQTYTINASYSYG